MTDDQPTSAEIAEAAAGVAVVVEALAPHPRTYISQERGPTPIDAMHPQWARRAADRVHAGDRPIEPRGVEKELRKRARE